MTFYGTLRSSLLCDSSLFPIRIRYSGLGGTIGKSHGKYISTVMRVKRSSSQYTQALSQRFRALVPTDLVTEARGIGDWPIKAFVDQHR
jgi:hypothetical protein